MVAVCWDRGHFCCWGPCRLIVIEHVVNLIQRFSTGMTNQLDRTVGPFLEATYKYGVHNQLSELCFTARNLFYFRCYGCSTIIATVTQSSVASSCTTVGSSTKYGSTATKCHRWILHHQHTQQPTNELSPQQPTKRPNHHHHHQVAEPSPPPSSGQEERGDCQHHSSLNHQQ